MLWRAIGIAVLAMSLAACASSMSGEYATGKGKTLPITKDVWAGYQEYVATIQNTNPGAFVVAADNGVGVTYTEVTCGAGHCRAGGRDAANWAMDSCKGHGYDCILFARSADILVNYQIVDGQ